MKFIHPLVEESKIIQGMAGRVLSGSTKLVPCLLAFDTGALEQLDLLDVEDSHFVLQPPDQLDVQLNIRSHDKERKVPRIGPSRGQCAAYQRVRAMCPLFWPELPTAFLGEARKC